MSYHSKVWSKSKGKITLTELDCYSKVLAGANW